ncbi:MAG: dTMP kinase, partial [Gemmatimonadota bacterium]
MTRAREASASATASCARSGVGAAAEDAEDDVAALDPSAPACSTCWSRRTARSREFDGDAAIAASYSATRAHSWAATSDRIEASGDAFLERVAAGFARLAAQQRWWRIDAHQPPEAVAADCRVALA